MHTDSESVMSAVTSPTTPAPQQQNPLRDESAARHAVRAINAHAVRTQLLNI